MSLVQRDGLLLKLKEMTTENNQLEQEIKLLSNCDPLVLKRKENEIKTCLEAKARWTGKLIYLLL